MRQLGTVEKQGSTVAKHKSTKLSSFEFQIFRRIESWDLNGKRLVVGLSGGADSVALLHVLAKLQPRLGFSLAATFVHHGPTTDEELSDYRRRALKVARRICRKLGVEFHGVRVKLADGKELRSESSLRKARHLAFAFVAAKIGADYICLGHHADDLFETRVIRLIRGTGSQGLPAMHEKGESFLRPFLADSRDKIRAYAKYANLEWIEDPSNKDPGPLRNWLRHVWIPELEKKRAGGAAAFARSLENLVSRERAMKPVNSVDLVAKLESDRGQIDRGRYMRLGVAERRQVLASLLMQLNANGFTRNHIDEIRKRIEAPKRFGHFEILGLLFQVNAEQVLFATK